MFSCFARADERLPTFELAVSGCAAHVEASLIEFGCRLPLHELAACLRGGDTPTPAPDSKTAGTGMGHTVHASCLYFCLVCGVWWVLLEDNVLHCTYIFTYQYIHMHV